MAKNIEKAAAGLKDIIDRNGMDYLTDEPYKVYLELIEKGMADKKTAGMILYLLVNDVPRTVNMDNGRDVVSKEIQTRCNLNKRVADDLADILAFLYSKDNKLDWKKKEKEGLLQFLQEEFVLTWRGFCIWDAGNGTVDCNYQAEIVLSPTEGTEIEKILAPMLKKNPFMTKKSICNYFEKGLCQYLDGEFEEYCTCDDYYQPVVEDFEIDYYVSEWSKRNGFELVSCKGRGEDGGYEPKF